MKKLLALLLSVAMVLCMMPTVAFAATEPTDITDSTLLKEDQVLTYNGSMQNPVKGIQLGDNTYTLSQLNSAGYKVEYTHNEPGKIAQKDAGTTQVKISPKDGNETVQGTITGSYEIGAKSITNGSTTITEDYTAPVAPGETITSADIKLYDTQTGKKLLVGDDFIFEDVDVAANAEGTVEVTVTGRNNYTDMRKLIFKVGKSISGATIDLKLPSNGFAYNGKAQTFSASNVKVTLGDTLLKINTDYIINYRDNIDAGENAKIIIEGRGIYAGKAEKTFTIKPKNIKSTSISVAAIPNQRINGMPRPEIKDTAVSSTALLKEGTDYTLEALDNEAVGTATLIIRGSGNYEGALEKKFNVKEALLPKITESATATYSYTGSPIDPVVTVTSIDTGRSYVLGRDYVIEGGRNTNAGTYEYYIVGAGNYAGKFGPYSYTISPCDLGTKGTVTLSSESFVYSSKAVEPSPTVTCGGRALRKDVDYTVTYLNNNRIGTASVIVYGKGNYSGSLTKTFRIVGKDLSQLTGTLDKTSYNYDGLEKKPAVSLYDGTKKLTNGVDYTVSYRNNKNAGTGEAIVTGKGNYGGTMTLTFRIVGKSQTVTTRYTRYSKTLSSKSFNLLAAHDGDGTLVYQSDNSAVAKVSAEGTVTVVGTGIAKITVSTTGNVKYDPASKVVYITVKPAKPTAKLTTPAKKQIKVTFTKVKGATKYQVRYGRMGKYYSKYVTHRDNDYTKTYTTINNRISGKTYYIKVRAYKELEDGTRIYGDWSPVQKIKAK